MTNHARPARACLLALLCAPGFGQSFSGEEVLLEPTMNMLRIAPMDVDGDGRMDVLAVGSGPGSLGWIRNDASQGFIQEAPILTDGSLRSVATADVDLDGDLDIVVGDNTSLSWLENIGGGQFGGRQRILSGVFSLFDMQAGDFDGDGDSDFAFLYFLPGVGSRIAWIENASVSGLGVAFGQAQLLSTAQGRYTNMVVADVDGDGDEDVLVADETAPAIILHENIAGGTLGPATVLTDAFARPYYLAVADVDADGVPDVLGAKRVNGPVEWVKNLGGGAFGPRRFGFSNSDHLEAFEVVDLDGDGATECLVTLGSGTSVSPDEFFLYRNTAGVFGPRQLLGSSLTGTGPRAFAAIDVDLDGDPDVVAAGRRRTVWHRNDGASLGAAIMGPPHVQGVMDAKAADLDGDGDADLLLALGEEDGGLFSWIENQAGVFGSAAKTFAIVAAAQVDALDLDQDGDLDIVSAGGSFDLYRAQVVWAENLGEGNFADSSVIYSNLADSAAVAAYGDMEGDGDLDILVSHREGFGASFIHAWMVNDPLGFSPGPIVPPSQVGQSIQLADLDGDGDADPAYLDPITRLILWRRNRGSGDLGQQALVSQPGMSMTQYAFADVDMDGDVDVVAVGNAGTVLLSNTGVGAFAPAVSLDTQVGHSVLMRDLDLDGNLDALVNTASVGARWMRNLGGGTFAAAVPLDGVASFAYDVADLDGDLDLDVLKRKSNGAIAINRNTDRFGAGYCGPAPVHSGGLSGRITASGSPSVAANSVQLRVEQLPSATFGFFLVADGQGFAANPGGSQGNLCLGGAIGRLLQVPGAVFLTGGDGAALVNLDLTLVPTPAGTTALVPGDTRYAQAWFRDTNPSATSNFTNGLALEFE